MRPRQHFGVKTNCLELTTTSAREVVLNLSTLRFANQLFEPTWNATCIESVEITFKEDIGTQGRGGYFDGPVRTQRDFLQFLNEGVVASMPSS